MLSQTFCPLITIFALFCVGHIGAYLCKEVCSHVSNAIMEDGGQGSLRAAKSVVNGERFSTWTVRWESGQCPSKSETKSVPEYLFMEAEVVLH